MKDNREKLTTMEKVMIAVNGALVLTGLSLLGYSVHRERKLNRLLDNSIKKVSGLTEVNVSDGIVNAGVERAVNNAVRHIANKAAQDCSQDIKDQVAKRVGEACKKSYSKIETDVAEKIATEVGKIYRDDLIEDIRTMAKDQIAAQFENKLDDVLENYNSNLSNINKIYQSIADSMTKKEDKGIKLQLA